MSVGRGSQPGPFDVIVEALDEPDGRATFMRGLMLGALVGAAVVGSVLRARQARRPRPRPVPPAHEAREPGSNGEAAIQTDLAEPGPSAVVPGS